MRCSKYAPLAAMHSCCLITHSWYVFLKPSLKCVAREVFTTDISWLRFWWEIPLRSLFTGAKTTKSRGPYLGNMVHGAMLPCQAPLLCFAQWRICEQGLYPGETYRLKSLFEDASCCKKAFPSVILFHMSLT